MCELNVRGQEPGLRALLSARSLSSCMTLTSPFISVTWFPHPYLEMIELCHRVVLRFKQMSKYKAFGAMPLTPVSAI